MKWNRLFIAAVGLLALSACQERRVGGPPRQAAYSSSRSEAIDGQLSADAKSELSADLHSPDAETRSHAIEAVSMVDADHSADLIQALSDREAMVRYTAAIAVGQMRLTAAHQALLAIAEDSDERVRVAVRFALHRIGDTHLSHQLEKLSQDTDPTVRGSTAIVLGLLGESSGLKILRPMRFDHNEAVRQQAAEAMWRLHDDEALQDLVALSLSKRPDDEMMGLLGLAAPRETIIREHVRAGLTADWPAVTLVAARAMGMLGSDEGFSIAMRGAQDADVHNRFLAAWALGDIGRTDAQPALRKLMHDTDPNVRIAAATAVLELKPRGYAIRTP